MAKTKSTKKSKSPAPAAATAPLDLARNFAIEAAKHAAATHCKDVVVLDVAGLSPVTDFFVIATGSSAVQMRTVCKQIAELGEKQKFAPFAYDGYEGESWMLTDFVDVVLHVFNPESRMYYDLDNLWGDAKKIEWKTSR